MTSTLRKVRSSEIEKLSNDLDRSRGHNLFDSSHEVACADCGSEFELPELLFDEELSICVCPFCEAEVAGCDIALLNCSGYCREYL